MRYPDSALAGLAIVCALCIQARADESTDVRLKSAVKLYVDGEYLQAVDSLLTVFPLITDKQSEKKAYRFLGFSYAMLRMETSAQQVFRTAIAKYPDMMLDTLEAPPNIMHSFLAAKAMRRAQLWERRRLPVVASTIAGILVCGGAGALLFTGYGGSGDNAYLIAGIASTACAVGLVPFPIYLLTKYNRKIVHSPALGLHLTPNGVDLMLGLTSGK